VAAEIRSFEEMGLRRPRAIVSTVDHSGSEVFPSEHRSLRPGWPSYNGAYAFEYDPSGRTAKLGGASEIEATTTIRTKNLQFAEAVMGEVDHSVLGVPPPRHPPRKPVREPKTRALCAWLLRHKPPFAPRVHAPPPKAAESSRNGAGSCLCG